LEDLEAQVLLLEQIHLQHHLSRLPLWLILLRPSQDSLLILVAAALRLGHLGKNKVQNLPVGSLSKPKGQAALKESK
jgi:hypothetical protein